MFSKPPIEYLNDSVLNLKGILMNAAFSGDYSSRVSRNAAKILGELSYGAPSPPGTHKHEDQGMHIPTNI
jgi:hypothetical protein